MLSVDIERATVRELQEAMDAGRLSAVELTDFYLDRIHRLNPVLRAVTEISPHARREAAESDAHRRRHGARGLLEGVPVLLKDNIDTADGTHTTAGSYALRSARPARDAYLVRRLRAAGAVVLGKANLSEWANFRSTSSSSGWSAVGGQTANPYVLDRNPSGSSSGSAVAAAANLAAVTIGTETNGSIVSPAAANSVVGVKPTLGLVSRSGIVPISSRQDTAGPVTRSVADAAAVLSVIQGVDPDDPATREAAAVAGRDLMAALDPQALAGARLGVWREPAGDDPETGVVLEQAVRALHDAGATVVEVKLPYLDEVAAAQWRALIVEFKHDLSAYLAATPGGHPKDLAGLIAFNRAHADVELVHFGQELFEQAESTSGDLTDPEYARHRATATALARRMVDDTLAAHDLSAIVAPTNLPPWRIDLANGDDRGAYLDTPTPAAVSGYPAVTVPAGYARGALPLGVTFFGPRFSEPVLLGFAYAFEQATTVRRPPEFLPTVD